MLLWLIYHPFEISFRIWSYSTFVLLDYVEYLADKITGDYESDRKQEYKPDQCPVDDSVYQEDDCREPMTPGRRTKRIKLVLDINVSPGGSRIVNVSTNDVQTAEASPSFLQQILLRIIRIFSTGVKIVKRILVVVHNVLVPHAKIHPLGPPRENRLYKSPTRRLPGYRRILAEFPFGLFGLQLTSRKCIISVEPLENGHDVKDKSESPESIAVIDTTRNQAKRKLSGSDRDCDSEVLTSPFSGISSEHSFQKYSPKSSNNSDREYDEYAASVHSSDDGEVETFTP